MRALLAVVERKSLADLVSSLTTGRLKYQLTDLATVPHATLVVEERYSSIFRVDHVRPSVVADGLAECQVRWPTVPIIFCETRKLAQEWTYRFLAAAWVAADEEAVGVTALGKLVRAGALVEHAPTAAIVRAWARAHNVPVNPRGRVRADVVEAYERSRC